MDIFQSTRRALKLILQWALGELNIFSSFNLAGAIADLASSTGQDITPTNTVEATRKSLKYSATIH